VKRVLNEKNFARLQSGMNGDEVRRVPGVPGSRQRLELSREMVWNWRLASQPTGGDPVFFSVHFNDEGCVVRTSRNVEYRG